MSGNLPIINGTEVKTSSRLRKIWLTTFRGYSLESTRQHPKQNAFGEIYYKAEYSLVKRAVDS